MRVLIVDEHEVFVWVACETFLTDHVVEVVHSLAAARELLGRHEFDVLLLDHDLPDGNGVELLSAEGSSLPPAVVAISAHEGGNTALVRAGADTACAKADFAEILNVLASFVTTVENERGSGPSSGG